jgi:hypothetical protein
MNCRHCQAPLRLPFVALGTAPPSNAATGSCSTAPGWSVPDVPGICRVKRDVPFKEGRRVHSTRCARRSDTADGGLADPRKGGRELRAALGQSW